MHQERYFAASSRQERVHITHQVVVAVREAGVFLVYDKTRKGWVEILESTARNKVAQALQYKRRRSVQHESAGVTKTPVVASNRSQRQELHRNPSTESGKLVSSDETKRAAVSTSTSNQQHGDNDDLSEHQEHLLSDEDIYAALGLSFQQSENDSEDDTSKMRTDENNP